MTVATGANQKPVLADKAGFANPVMPTGVGPTGAALPPARSPEVGVEAATDRDAHLLRLSLDLQLDAMLLVLGASAAGSPEDAMPWRRWLSEDVDLAWELTTTALAVHGGLPASLGPDLANADPVTLTEDLLARYTSMCGLLEDVLARDTVGRTTGASTGAAWHDHVRAALARHQNRVGELRAHLASMRRAGSGGDAERPAAAAHYLPGELLG